MLKPGLLVALTIFMASACHDPKLEKAGVRTGGNLDQSAVISDERSLETTFPSEKEESEQIVPPNNIAGSFLVCEFTKTIAATDVEADVQCALKDKTNNNKVDLKSQFASYRWNYELAANSNLTVALTELPNSPDWHVNYHLKGIVAGDFQIQIKAAKFLLTLQDKAGVSYETKTAPTLPFVQWSLLNGAPVPSQAAVGGTWMSGSENIFICRLHTGNEVLPGKLLIHFNDPTKSICYSINAAGNSVQSQSEDAQTMFVQNDGLLIPQGTFDEYFEWVAATNGQFPANAFVTGMDAQSKPLYTCRGVQINATVPDPTPGVLRPGSTGCVHENKLLAELRNDYQVLAWKVSGTTKIRAGQTNP